jgi:hypothetical protein
MIGASRKLSIEPRLRTESWKGLLSERFPVPAMRPEGSRRQIGVICTEVALQVDADGRYVYVVML